MKRPLLILKFYYLLHQAETFLNIIYPNLLFFIPFNQTFKYFFKHFLYIFNQIVLPTTIKNYRFLLVFDYNEFILRQTTLNLFLGVFSSSLSIIFQNLFCLQLAIAPSLQSFQLLFWTSEFAGLLFMLLFLIMLSLLIWLHLLFASLNRLILNCYLFSLVAYFILFQDIAL